MNLETIDPLWSIADPLTVRQAAALIAGRDPNAVRFDSFDDGWFEDQAGCPDCEGAVRVRTAFTVLINAINAGKLKATFRRDAHLQGWDEFPNRGEGIRSLYEDDGAIRQDREPTVIYCESPNWGKTTVDRQDLISWLESKGINTGFFFPMAPDAPDYLDPKNPRYAPKLAAAVRAWQAVTDPNGKHPKQALAKWLREHAAEFGLTDNDGRPNDTGIEEVSKVANWQPGGGAPKTPGQ